MNQINQYLLEKKFVVGLRSIFYLLITSIFLSGCVSTSKSKVAVAYHNTTAHYNAYFQAREKMKEMENGLHKSIIDNYNKPLEIFPKTDKSTAASLKGQIDVIIKKASMPIQWHKNSKWVDDSYLLITKCRFYDADWENALTTANYINRKSDDENLRAMSLIWTMRTYMANKEPLLAREVAEYIKTIKKIDKKTASAVHINLAYYQMALNEKALALEELKLGVKKVKPHQKRARIYYLIGQLSQELNQDTAAFKAYKNVLKNNPDYELWFNAKLNVAQATDLNKVSREKILKFYNRLLKDIKNEEYKDKIYFEMAKFEYKQDHLDPAIDYYKKSIKTSKAGYVKGYSYLKIAEIYYDRKQDFENAKLYYDSTVATIDKDATEYPKALKRQRILAEFVKHLRIVQLQDSLQKLAKMDPKEVEDKFLRQILKEEADQLEIEKNAIKEAKRLQKEKDVAEQLAKLETLQGTQPNSGMKSSQQQQQASGLFYFANPQTIAQGKNEFSRKWNNRKLEDNWRRSVKETNGDDIVEDTDKNKNITQNIDSDTTKSKKTIDKEKREKSESNKVKLATMMAEIPIMPEQMDSSNARLKRSLFKIASIYDKNLEEYDNAIKNYTRFYTQFADDDIKSPEALYAQYLIYLTKKKNQSSAENTKAILLEKYPNSLYAKLLINPNYLKENQAEGERIKSYYRIAYQMYERKDYLGTFNYCKDILEKYPKNEFEDKFALLFAITNGRTQDVVTYKKLLSEFVEKYKKSKLVPLANDMIAKADGYMLKTIESQVDVSKEQGFEQFVTYNLDLNVPHYYVVMLDITKFNADEVKQRMEEYNMEFYMEETFVVNNQKLTSEMVALTVKGFPNSIQAKNYYEKHKGSISPLRRFSKDRFTDFIITDANLKIFLKSKNLNSYVEFFKKNYPN